MIFFFKPDFVCTEWATRPAACVLFTPGASAAVELLLLIMNLQYN